VGGFDSCNSSISSRGMRGPFVHSRHHGLPVSCCAATSHILLLCVSGSQGCSALEVELFFFSAFSIFPHL